MHGYRLIVVGTQIHQVQFATRLEDDILASGGHKGNIKIIELGDLGRRFRLGIIVCLLLFYRSTVAGLINEVEAMRCPHTVTTCEAAIAMLEEGEADDLPDIILMDIGLPDAMNGGDGTRLIKAIIPTTQIIMLTIDEEDDVVFEALRVGASGYILKNVSTNRILAAIKETRNGEVSMTGSIAFSTCSATGRRRASTTG